MFKLSIPVCFLVVLSLSLSSSTFATTNYNQLTETETRFKQLIENADLNLELNQTETALSQYNEAALLLSQNDTIGKSLQGHFFKVGGKFHMKTDKQTALTFFNKAILLFENNNNRIADVNLFVGITYYYAGEYNTAEAYYLSSKAVFETNGNLLNLAQVLNNLALIYYFSGRRDEAVVLCNQAISINSSIQQVRNLSKNHYNLSLFVRGFAEELVEKKEVIEITSNTGDPGTDPEPSPNTNGAGTTGGSGN